MDPILQLRAFELRDRLAQGSVRAVELVQAYLDQIEAREPEVGAWTWYDADHATAQAAALDKHRGTGRAIGPMHGLPVGIKDVVDTARIPTENGTVIDVGRVPIDDAAIVARLKQAGAVIMGKTVTAELAYERPAGTRNPHDPARTAGGSSSGSAAAVAGGMVPLAVGTDTAGSVIRPAAYCGVVGFKPTYGAIPRTGVLSPAPSLDTIGVMACAVEDAALLADQLYGWDAGDAATTLAPGPRLLDAALSQPPVTPAIAFVKQPAWGEADQDMQAGLAELVDALGDDCDEVELPAPFAEADRLQRCVRHAEMARSLHAYGVRGRDRLSRQIRAAIDDGNQIGARDYLEARDWRGVLNSGLEEVFARFDAILTPAATGAAPEGLDTGNPAFNNIWSFCGTPAVTLPLLEAPDGLPMGVQLVGRRNDDARLLRTARWLTRRLLDAD